MTLRGVRPAVVANDHLPLSRTVQDSTARGKPQNQLHTSYQNCWRIEAVTSSRSRLPTQPLRVRMRLGTPFHTCDAAYNNSMMCSRRHASTRPSCHYHSQITQSLSLDRVCTLRFRPRVRGGRGLYGPYPCVLIDGQELERCCEANKTGVGRRKARGATADGSSSSSPAPYGPQCIRSNWDIGSRTTNIQTVDTATPHAARTKDEALCKKRWCRTERRCHAGALRRLCAPRGGRPRPSSAPAPWSCNETVTSASDLAQISYLADSNAHGRGHFLVLWFVVMLRCIVVF